MKKYILYFLSILLICPFAEAKPIQSHESLSAAVMNFLKEETKGSTDIEISLQALDPRLRLHQCSSNLQTFWPMERKNFGKVTIGIRCNGEKPWKIFMGAHLHIYKYVWVSKFPLSRGQLIANEDISKEKRDITKLSSGYIPAKDSLVGMQLKRSVGAEQVLSNTMITSQKVIKRGDRIAIISKFGGIVVRATGIALSDGAKGEKIRVRNTSSKREIEAYVSDKQQVLVAL